MDEWHSTLQVCINEYEYLLEIVYWEDIDLTITCIYKKELLVDAIKITIVFICQIVIISEVIKNDESCDVVTVIVCPCYNSKNLKSKNMH